MQLGANVAFTICDNTVSDLAIIGNGLGVCPPLSSGIPFIRFNLPIEDTFLVSVEIRICNRKVAGISDYSNSFVVQGSILLPDEHFQLQEMLAASAQKLSRMLGCLPPVGWTAVHALQSTGA